MSFTRHGFLIGVGRAGGYSGAYAGPYQAFIEPDDRIYFADDHCSHVVTWQECAALSAQHIVSMLAERVRPSKS